MKQIFLIALVFVGLMWCSDAVFKASASQQNLREAEAAIRATDTARTAELMQARLDSLTKKKMVPGATLAVRYRDGRTITLASGLADQENKIPMRPDAVMFSGSVGKTYVAAVVLKLHEKGLINLDKKAAEYLKDEIWFTRVPNAADIKVSMLLNHTAGIPEYVYSRELWQKIRSEPDKVWTVEERLSYVSGRAPVHPAARGWSYADSHYLVLGLIIEKVTGKSYYEVLDELILGPCKLNHTIAADRRDLPGLIPGYTGLTEAFLLPSKVLAGGLYAFNPQLEWTGGGLITTVSDLTRWMHCLHGEKLLSSESHRLMITPAPFSTGLFENAGYGFGSFVGITDGITYYGHTGFVPGYITYVQYLPDSGTAIAFQFNCDNPHRSASIDNFFNSLKRIALEDL
jgi:D-alanyl-D-alanine carboxypeptidase